MDTHEISMQSAVMSGLEDSSQFFTRSNMNTLFEDNQTFTKNYVIKELVNK